MSGIFGWSYPPGCNGTPWDDDQPCEVCGKDVDRCICAECKVCGCQGDPQCYDQEQEQGHGLVRTAAQVESLRSEMDKWEAIAQAEAEYWEARAREEAMAAEEAWP
jgi:hypothetical protein